MWNNMTEAFGELLVCCWALDFVGYTVFLWNQSVMMAEMADD